jgi:glycerol-3-phosphate dehydrogenase
MIFNGPQRQETLDSVPGKTYDLLVVGGGITGACIARDAARRGLDVLLLDKNDWAFGTSSRSSKLVHGGLRYLELFDFKLVFEACRERRRLLINAPHLVWPQPFTFPVYKGDKNGLFMIGAGLWLYDILALFRNVQNHRLHGPKRILEVEPGLDRSRLKGGGEFYDCATDDARLTLAHVQSARLEGADCVNYARVTGFLRRGDGQLCGARVRDELSGREYDAEARVVVNATGPWTDKTCWLEDEQASAKLRPTKGAHVIVPRQRAYTRNALPIMSPRDQRLLFIVPWGDFALIGTTDTDYEGDYDELYADREDVDYILEAANAALPEARLETGDIVSTYAGLRPLICEQGSEGISESQVSREHSIYESHSGLITITGGKLTTARSMAEELVDLAVRRLSERFEVRGIPRCSTKYAGVYGKDGAHFPARLQELARQWRVDDDVICNLASLGTGAVEVLAMVRNDLSRGERLHEEVPYIRAMVEYAVTSEMALTIDDFMVRRSRIYYEAPDQGLEVLDAVAGIMQVGLGWSDEETERQKAAYRHTVELSRLYRK